MLDSEAACRQYLEEQDPATIACQLRHDQELCQSQRLPSSLALYAPRSHSKLGGLIATELCSSNSTLPRSIRALQYSGILQGIKAYLHQMTPLPKHGPLPVIRPSIGINPSREEFEITLRVLGFCIKSRDSITVDTPLGHVISIIQNDLEVHKGEINENFSTPSVSKTTHIPAKSSPKEGSRRKCYICRFQLSSTHPQYPSLCKPCGDFNLASCDISAPANLCLKSRTALVTGGRVNLGYHTAIRLLRCGAKVIVSTRYPRDAEDRYLAQKDSSEWSQSLRIVGADFRIASDVFHMITVVKECLLEWCENGDAKLDILVNNAAQTLTDSVDTERNAVVREGQLQISGTHAGPKLLLDQDYKSRVRGGVQSPQMLGSTDKPLHITSLAEGNSLEVGSDCAPADGATPVTTVSVVPAESLKSSWMQSISQVPYEDIISAHSVNTFVPLILVRELLVLMGSATLTPPTASSSNTPSKPLAYIINVSSREGIFESNPNSSAKHGHHVHTNLTKAALNMLTETEASPAWRSRKVAMNTVDPGYMSAAPEIMEQWKENGRSGCPIGWEDGVGRVLWPIAVGERSEPVWGRFLKHFGKVEVDVGVGR